MIAPLNIMFVIPGILYWISTRWEALQRYSLKYSPVSEAAGLVLMAFGFAYAAPLAWIGIGLFVVAYIRFFAKPRRSTDRMWRGQSIEDPPSPSAPSRWWRWIRGE